ncbi:hypothetical protein FB550_12128 [Neobacillus bataviensis]|uniref:Uncharacterized protein n=1 Tax=Neobacillus bataviensis TaxID=220685 RepID=A0A561CK95_9BACI|nr:hypothetical protein [Neobacillus bataviensis]TWD91586.1 hypothetical protein FB550_12128 [Neobacillus bataviensis]
MEITEELLLQCLEAFRQQQAEKQKYQDYYEVSMILFPIISFHLTELTKKLWSIASRNSFMIN